MEDDLDMEALRGDIPSLAAAVVAAGCDLALNCWGRIEEVRGITEVLDEIRPESRIRLDRAMAPIAHTPEAQPLDELLAKRDEPLALILTKSWRIGRRWETARVPDADRH